jgi:hypothetical protein
MLRRLHSLHLDRSAVPHGTFTPAWPPEMTAAVLSLFPDIDRDRLAARLAHLKRDTLPLLDPVCPISGDPNPLNWGCRDDGSLVLFDWERFTFGTPAIDLAITIPGLGDEATYLRVASVYLGDAATSDAVSDLARAIRQGKVWSVVEFLAGVADGSVEPAFPVNTLIKQVSDWARSSIAL